MKNYIEQFYTEGLAKIFYEKPVNYLNKRINNKKICHFLEIMIKVFYTLLVLAFAGYILYKKLHI